MDGAAGILVIILAVALAVFLLLAIILMILLIRISRQIKHITQSAEHTMESAEGVMKNMRRFTTPAILGKLVVGTFKRRRKGGTNVKRK